MRFSTDFPREELSSQIAFSTVADERRDGPTRPIDIEGTAGDSREKCVLLETSGVQAGCPHPIRTDLATIGRGRDCTVRIDDQTLSRVHARIRKIGQTYVLEDLGSKNGSFVNDERVDKAVLVCGDRIRLSALASLRFNLITAAEEDAIMRVYASSVTDALTGVWNRRHLEQRLLSELAFATRHGSELSLLIVDLDHFKEVNDVHGHPTGDLVLRTVADVIAKTLRTEDMVARFGGEEFAVILRSTSIDGAARLAERLRQGIAATPIYAKGGSVRVTASIGAASLRCCGAGRNVAELFGRADERLYRAKAEGRNRVVGS